MLTEHTIHLGWGRKIVELQSREHLEECIRAIEIEGAAKDQPIFGEMSDGERVIMVVFGRSWSAVRYYDLPSKRGDASFGQPGEETEVAYYGDVWTEFDACEVIPYAEALAAFFTFYQTRTKPQNINWQIGWE